EDSAWSVLGRVVLAVVRLAGVVLLYGLRLVLAPAETAKGLRRLVLAAAPIPEGGPGRVTAEVTPGTASVPETAPALETVPAPGVLPEAAPEVTPRPALEAVPDLRERPPASSAVTPGKQPGPATPERLAAFYAADLAEGRVPSKRQIKRDWPV